MSIPFLTAMWQQSGTSFTGLRPRPTASSWSGTATFSSHSNDSVAYDTTAASVDTTTYQTMDAIGRPRTNNGVSLSTTIYSGFGSGTSGYTWLQAAVTTVTLTVDSQDLTNQAISNVELSYSITNGASWVSLGFLGTGGVDSVNTVPYQGYLPTPLELSTLQIKIECYGESVGGTISDHAAAGSTASVYDIVLL